jgi:hypothetical protein
MSRTRCTALAVTALVLATLVACSSEESSSSPDAAPTAATPAPDDLFTCDRSFSRATVPPDDLVEQGGISEWTGGYIGEGYEVKRAAASPLGLVALVVGDLEAAKAFLIPRGVSLVGPYDDTQSKIGTNPFAQVNALVLQQMGQPLADVKKAVRDLEGEYDVVPWTPNGEIVIEWQEPVPAEVTALAAELPNRVRIAVEPVPYSRADVDAAIAAVDGAGDLGVEVASTDGCADGTGLVVGAEPDSLGDRRAELQDSLAEVAGMPVLVVPLDEDAA